jgi:hypothetical protein
MLDLIWLARFKDGTTIQQYTADTEIRFQEVLDKQEQLEKFILYNRNFDISYVVDLGNGTISMTRNELGLLEPRADMLRKDSYEYRLIYFREVTKTFTSNLQQIGTDTTLYFLGFQYLDENGKNHKRIYKISSDGRTVIN